MGEVVRQVYRSLGMDQNITATLWDDGHITVRSSWFQRGRNQGWRESVLEFETPEAARQYVRDLHGSLTGAAMRSLIYRLVGPGEGEEAS
jgi:hypothetical protein